jgi:cytochrome c556
MRQKSSCLLAVGLALLAWAAPRAQDRETSGAQRPAPEKIAAQHLPNAYRVHPRVISGGLPQGEQAFGELAALGVRTIVSVDGAKPDVAGAAQFGLTYVHLPHGYDGIPAERARELAKAVRDLPGPVYVHCHHGQHRSPAAAAVACITAGLIEPAAGETILKQAGTSEHYLGLFQAVRAARPLDRRELDALQAEFPATAKVPPLAEAMVAIEHVHDRLKAAAAAHWNAPPGDPDLVPAHEALLLKEQFAELLRTDDAARFPQRLREAQAAASELEAALRTARLPAAAAALARVNANCTDCHRRHRDMPRRERN